MTFRARRIFFPRDANSNQKRSLGNLGEGAGSHAGSLGNLGLGEETNGVHRRVVAGSHAACDETGIEKAAIKENERKKRRDNEKRGKSREKKSEKSPEL